ncbi:ChaC-like protein, partial [Phaeosphaeriaceae sp. PMI808]
SLIWKPPPHYDQRVPGYIEGYVRRFWQDHRGTPEAPGRVVTLIDKAHWETLTDHHASTERVWGAAYHIPTQHVTAVREYLDLREINGYSIQFTPFHRAPLTTSIATLASRPPSPSPGIKASTITSVRIEPSPASITCLVYIGLPSNPQFLGPQEPGELAEVIWKSRGPSGENREYLWELERGLAKVGGDAHVVDLAERCREIERKEGGGEE